MLGSSVVVPMASKILINFHRLKDMNKSYRPGFVISDPVTQKALNGLVTIVPITNSISTFFTRVNLDKYNIRTKR